MIFLFFFQNFSEVQCFSKKCFVKRKAKFTIEQQKWKGHEKCDRLLILKMERNNQISQRNKSLRIDPVFSNWVNFNKKVSRLNCFANSNSFKAIYFFL